MLLRADGAVRMLSGGGLPLGLFPDAEPATQVLGMDPGDVLFLYTDGVAQARGQDNSYFADRLADELTGLAGSPPDQLVASMRQAMLKFSGGNLIDDVTMLVLRASRLAAGPPAARSAGHPGARSAGPHGARSNSPGKQASRSAGPS
jgi:serine phosphatase RsbU (regulator of sigma subunit)